MLDSVAVVEMGVVRRNRAAVAPVIAYWNPTLTHYGEDGQATDIKDKPDA